ncbi:MAG: HEAT repeat domain-containing protein [Armatimonadota bacterium]
MPRLVGLSDVVAKVELTLTERATADFGPLEHRPPRVTCRGRVLRVFKGDRALEGQDLTWTARDWAARPDRPALEAGPAGIALLVEVDPDGTLAATHDTGGFIRLPPGPDPLEPPPADPVEATKAELLRCLAGEDWGLASAAAARLGFFPRDKTTEEALTELLHRLEPGLALVACAALVRTGAPRGVQAAVDLLRAPLPLDPESRRARRSLINRLADLTDDRHLKHLVALIESGEADVRAGMAHALGEMASPEAVQALGEALWDADQMVRYRVITSLAEITMIRGHVPLPPVYREQEDVYLAFWRKWYEEVGKPGVEEPDGAQDE